MGGWTPGGPSKWDNTYFDYKLRQKLIIICSYGSYGYSKVGDDQKKRGGAPMFSTFDCRHLLIWGFLLYYLATIWKFLHKSVPTSDSPHFRGGSPAPVFSTSDWRHGTARINIFRVFCSIILRLLLGFCIYQCLTQPVPSSKVDIPVSLFFRKYFSRPCVGFRIRHHFSLRYGGPPCRTFGPPSGVQIYVSSHPGVPSQPSLRLFTLSVFY